MTVFGAPAVLDFLDYGFGGVGIGYGGGDAGGAWGWGFVDLLRDGVDVGPGGYKEQVEFRAVRVERAVNNFSIFKLLNGGGRARCENGTQGFEEGQYRSNLRETS